MKAQEKPRVYILDNSRQMTGAFRSSLNIASQLKDRYHFTYWLPSTSLLAEVSDKKMASRFIPFLEIRKNLSIILYLPALLFHSLRIARAARREQVQVIHVNDLYNMCGVVIKILRPATRVVYHVRLLPGSYVSLMFRFWARLINRYADDIVVVSNAVKKQWPGARVPVVIHDAMEEPAVKNQHAHPERPVRLLYLANFIAGKGHRFAVEAFDLARQRFPALTMTMVGGDLGLRKNRKYQADILELIRGKRLTDVITLSPFEKDVHHVLVSHDIFLNFSESESFSMTCLEAMHAGTPVIATRSGGPEELIEDGVSGILVNNRDIYSMSKGILTLAEHRDMRLRLAEAALRRVREQFSISSSARNIETVYSKLVSV